MAAGTGRDGGRGHDLGKGRDGARGIDLRKGEDHGTGRDGGKGRDFSRRPYTADEERVAEILRSYGQTPGEDPIGELAGNTIRLLEYRAAHEAPGWNYEGDFRMGAHLSDAEVASKVRMLMRGDLDHEMVCTLARDRIRDLSRRVKQLEGVIADAGLEAPKP